MEATTMDVVTYSNSTSDNISNEHDSVTTANLDIHVSTISSNTMSVESLNTQSEPEGQTSENQVCIPH